MANITYVPSRIGEGHFTDFQAPASGSTDNGKVWAWNSTTSKFEPTTVSGGGGSTPGGSDTEIQYNNAGVLAGAAGITRTGSGTLSLSTALVSPVIRPASDSTTAIKIQNTAGTTDVLLVNTTSGAITINSTTTQQINLSSTTHVAFGFTSNSGSTVRTGLFQLDSSGNFVFRTNQSAMYFDVYDGGYWRTGTGGGQLYALVAKSGSISVGANVAPTAYVDISASTTSRASLRIRSGTAPTTPNAGDVWFDGANLKFYDGSATRTITWT